MRIFDITVLLESFDRGFITACDTKNAVRKYPFGIDQMAENFLDRPFAVRIRIGAFLLGNSGEYIPKLCHLARENGDNFIVDYERNVFFVVRVVL